MVARHLCDAGVARVLPARRATARRSPQVILATVADEGLKTRAPEIAARPRAAGGAQYAAHLCHILTR